MKKTLLTAALLLASLGAYAADNYVQSTSSGDQSTTCPLTLNSVVAGNAIVAFLGDGSGSPATHTVADGQGSYTAKGSAIFDSGNNVWVQAYVLENANSGTHSLTGTVDSGHGCVLVAAEIGVTSQPGYQDAQSVEQNGPGAGTDAVTTASLTIASASTLVGFGVDTSTFGSNPPVAGTGFTTRGTAASSNVGDWRLETGAFAANHAATFTAGAGTGGNHFVSFGVALANTGSGGGGGGSNKGAASYYYRQQQTQ